jgi:glycosyltransferase involved in cell wall biosynthesis
MRDRRTTSEKEGERALETTGESSAGTSWKMPALEKGGARGMVTEGRGLAPLVSIGLAVRNGERFLAQALDSLLGQTLQDFELIISDNASTDGTADICLDYAARDARIRYVRQPSNIGGPGNWNFVALEARGRYFKWAAADDFCDRRMLEKCVAVLNADPSVVLCYGRACIVDEETEERRPYEHEVSVVDPRPSERFRTVFRAPLFTGNVIQGVIRLDVLRRTRLEPLPLYPSGDMVLMAELALLGRFVLLPEILFYRRLGPRTWSMRMQPGEAQAFFLGFGSYSAVGALRLHPDYVKAVFRAPIAASEKLRALAVVARRATGDLLRAMGIIKIRREVIV